MVKNMIALTESFPDGQRITGVAIEYDAKLSLEAVTPECFAVEGRNVVGAYVNDEPRPTRTPRDGRYVIVRLSKDDENAKTVVRFKPKHGPGGPGGPGRPKLSLNSTRRKIALVVSQLRAITDKNGQVQPTFDRVKTEGAWEELVEKFQQFEHGGMAYDLFIPEGYDPGREYPLVMFIPDATGGGNHPKICIEQGNGAVNFVRDEDQKKHPSFVLGIQYGLEGPLTHDDFTVNEEGVQQILGVLDHVLETYSIDRNRIYTTGQSMGCMTSCELNIRRPDLFAASLLVAGQWDPVKMGRLHKKNFWILVSEHDEKAFPGMNAITAAMESNGSAVGRYMWNAKAGAEALDDTVKAALRDDVHIRYTVFEGDSVVPDGEEANGRTNHMSTWPVVYGIGALRDWLFTQKKARE